MGRNEFFEKTQKNACVIIRQWEHEHEHEHKNTNEHDLVSSDFPY